MPVETVDTTGLSYRSKLAMGLMMACAPCCSGSGGGSGGGGSGSGSESFIPCNVLEDTGGATFTLDYEVTGCQDGSDTGLGWLGEACSASALFNAGTANIFEGADTTFDENDVPGPTISFQWCDGELTYWVNNASYTGLIEFAFCCMTRDDSTTYLCFYALLTLTCYVAGNPVGVIQYAYKTRDIAYESGDPFTLSITGLTPFASLTTGTCSCSSPSLSIALHVDMP